MNKVCFNLTAVLQDVGRTREKLLNHEPEASDLQDFRVY